MVGAKIYNLPSKIAEDVMDWTGCDMVEVNPRKVSGVPIVKGTRVQADAIVENYEGGSAIEEIAENFAIPQATIRELLEYAHSHNRLVAQ